VDAQLEFATPPPLPIGRFRLRSGKTRSARAGQGMTRASGISGWEEDTSMVTGYARRVSGDRNNRGSWGCLLGFVWETVGLASGDKAIIC